MGPKIGKRFSFRSDPRYDLALLTETETINPFVHKVQGKSWELIANTLKSCDLKMDVSARTCKDRFTLLMDEFKKDEAISSRASGVSEDQLDEIKELLTKIKELMDSTSTSVKKLYSKKGREQAEVTRTSALDELADLEVLDAELYDTIDLPRPAVDGSQECATSDCDSDKEGSGTKKRMGKRDMIGYLEKKQKKEYSFKQGELEKEYSFKQDELEVRRFEAENRKLELEIQKQKQEADANDRAKITDLLIKLVNK